MLYQSYAPKATNGGQWVYWTSWLATEPETLVSETIESCTALKHAWPGRGLHAWHCMNRSWHFYSNQASIKAIGVYPTMSRYNTHTHVLYHHTLYKKIINTRARTKMHAKARHLHDSTSLHTPRPLRQTHADSPDAALTVDIAAFKKKIVTISSS